MTTLFFRLWGVMSGGITLFLIPLYLGEIEQGYYFAFSSILAMQVFFELGFGQVVVQFVAHEFAGLKIDRAGSLLGPEKNIVRLYSLVVTLKKWYRFSSILFFTSVSCAGYCFFIKSQLPLEQWLFPWIILVGATAYNLLISWKLAVIEGASMVKEIGAIRLFQSVVGFSLAWLGLVFDAQLWIVVAVPISAGFISTLWLKFSSSAKFIIFLENTPRDIVENIWFGEIFPFQWRIALSWVSGFFIFQLFTPIVFKNYGAVEAGKIGFVIAVFNSVTTVSIAWVAAKVPVLAGLIAQKKNIAANRLFVKLIRISVLFSIVFSIFLIIVYVVIDYGGFDFINKISDLNIVLGFALAAIANCFVLCSALYMRAHKEEPMLSQSLVLAFAVALTIFYFQSHGTSWLVWSYTILCLTLSVPWTVWLLLRKYNLIGLLNSSEDD